MAVAVALSFAPSPPLDVPPLALIATPSLPLRPNAGPGVRAVDPAVEDFAAAVVLGAEGGGGMDFRELDEADATSFPLAVVAGGCAGVGAGTGICVFSPLFRRIVWSWKNRQSSPESFERMAKMV